MKANTLLSAEGAHRKRELRQRFRLARSQLSQSTGQRESAHALLAAHLNGFLSIQPASPLAQTRIWAAYLAMPDEASADLSRIASDVIEWAYPVLYGETLQFFIPRSLQDLAANRYGILEPVPERSRWIGVDELTGVLVPGVAFDRFGTRLGQGKGFYDRALASYLGIKIGVAYAAQISADALPCDPHDVVMTHLLTEHGVVSCL